jgi:hypothetical protein
MDERIEALLRDLQDERGKDSNVIRENVRRHLAEREEQFRHYEVDPDKKDEAAQRCRSLIRKRVVEEESRTGGSTATHWRFVLSTIDDPTRAPPQNRRFE